MIARHILPLAALLALAGCAAETFPERPEPAPSAPSFYTSMATPGARVDAQGAAEMISLYRGNHGLEPVAVDSGLMEEARRQAEAMSSADKLSHEVRGSLTDRLNRAGYAKSKAVENVSAGYHTVAEAFSGWRDSPPHNANMLASGMKRMGIAAVYNPRSKYHVFWALVMAN
ncbi:hypothetical protein CCR94_19640 [Rhodoblastus sphagnicola]|uniref:SCP domain-containing protein n=2 Tax=Rhodoblastus sphagnicola TaxID=333368 RepID=A0A2S6MZC7_9HYPH|nr:hypothetical protein CCR94_19640 [Rhodoblastus sphagnicola]